MATKAITNTLWSIYIQDCLHLGRPFQKIQYTTLNEKLNILPNVSPAPTQYPELKYYAIGSGGATATIGVNNRLLINSKDHEADHAALYDQQPFVLRPIDNDLTQAQRANYALRREEVHGGVSYYAYYLKALNIADVVPTIKRTKIVDGISVTEPYIPTSANLNPVPPALSNTGTITTSGAYLSASATVTNVFTEFDVAEFMNVNSIKFGDPAYAMITEIAYVTAIDKVVTISTSAGISNFTEAVCAQISAFIPCSYPLVYHNRGFEFGANVGSGEPVLESDSITTGTTLNYTDDQV